MNELFRDVSPEDGDLQPIIDGLFGEYSARYGDYFSKDAEVELTEWYLPPQGLFIVLERDGEIGVASVPFCCLHGVARPRSKVGGRNTRRRR